MRTGRPARTLVVLVALGALTVTGAQAAPTQPEAPTGTATLPPGADEVVEPAAAEELVTEIPAAERDATLGDGWETSTDQSWTLSGDPSGLHVLLADAADAYAWRTVATLAQPGVETDRWIGNACLTESGDRLVVAYAPRSFTNEPELFLQGAWTSVVDLTSGAVTELPLRGSLEYFSPSCGHGEDAVLTVSGGEEVDATRLVTVDAATAALEAPVEVAGQVTSAIPTDAGLVAAVGTQVARIEPTGRVTPLAAAKSVPYELTTDADGGVVFLEHDGTTATVRRLDTSRLTKPRPKTEAPALAKGPLGEVGVTRTPDGQVLLTGNPKPTRTLPKPVRVADVAKDAEVSADGRVVVEVTSDRTPLASPEGAAVDATASLSTIETRVTGLTSGRAAVVDAIVDGAAPRTEAGPGPDASEPGDPDERLDPSATSRAFDRAAPSTLPGAVVAASDPLGIHNPVDVGRGCSVPRNSVLNQAMQPKPRQVEWAVNQAVKGALTVQREANWKNLQMPAYTPQGMFPSIPLSGGGEVPSQVLLGILAQESNLWQANGYVVPGVTGSPLIGNYYGIDYSPANPEDLWNPDFSAVDCGYGVAQVTDGMRLADTGLPGGRSWNEQRAIALDFAANVAAGLRILQEKWNQTRGAGLTINDGNPGRIENWFYAIWAYNTGFYPEADKFTQERNGAWGVGWLNNPANPSYSPSRPFFHLNPRDAAHPQDWPYPEKVIGFAAFPPSLLESPSTFVPAFRPATWNGVSGLDNTNRLTAKPPVYAFCQIEANDCNPLLPNGGSGNGAYGACFHKNSVGQYDGRCWYNQPVTWKATCSVTCGYPFLRFSRGYEYQADGTAYAPACTRFGLPPGALVVDDQPATVPVVRPGCTPVASNGSFEMTFSSGTNPAEFPSKMDLHQLGAGFGGHFWFGHTRDSALRGGSMEFSGTWTLDRPLQQWTRVLVHLPDHGAHTRQAEYVVDTGLERKERTIAQRIMRNGWVSLGVFEVNGVPSVTLSTETNDGDDGVAPAKNEDIAFDAVAFVPLDAKPQDFVVALGDSFSSGEGAGDYYAETDFYSSHPKLRDFCRRSPVTWSRLARIPGSSTSLGERADGWDPSLDYHLLACSQAETKHLRQANSFSMWGERSQLNRNFVDENTTLVTISIGGNDAGVATVMKDCLSSICGRDVVTGVRDTSVEERIHNEVGPAVIALLDEIHALAPDAEILYMGYPPLISGVCDFATLNWIDQHERAWLNDLAPVLNAELASAVADVNSRSPKDFVRFVDPTEDFDGKGVCGSPELIHSIVFDPSELDKVEWEIAQSFHPKAAGYLVYADLMTRTLAGG